MANPVDYLYRLGQSRTKTVAVAVGGRLGLFTTHHLCPHPTR